MAGPSQHKGDSGSGHHTSIDIEGNPVDTKDESDSTYHDARETNEEHPNKVFVDSINSKVKSAFPSLVSAPHSCIYRVHKKFHKMNENAYTPEVVSIGPLHHQHREGNLQAMEECKLLYMYALLSRIAKAKVKDNAETSEKIEVVLKYSKASAIGSSSSTKLEESITVREQKNVSTKLGKCVESIREKKEEDEPARPIRKIEDAMRASRKGIPDPKTTGWLTILEECGESIRKIEKLIRRCYSETFDDLNSNQFVEMMLIDGLFMIELFRRGVDEVTKGKYDPLFAKIGTLSSLTGDLLLLENQLPMIVLDCLFKVPALQKELQGSSLNMLILRFFDHLMPKEEKDLEKFSTYKSKHLLDLLAHTFHPLDECGDRNDTWKSVPSVTELRRSGIRFKKGSTTGSFLDIKFNKGVLEIPHVIIQDKTDLLFRNLIASEQCSDGDVTYMTSYAFFMDSLIDSAHDVELLRNEGIITNYLGSNQEVSDLFNKLCCEVIIDNFYYSKLCDDLNKHYKNFWHRWEATLKRDYCNSPCAIISFFAALLLIALTLTATLFALLSFFIHKS